MYIHVAGAKEGGVEIIGGETRRGDNHDVTFRIIITYLRTFLHDAADLSTRLQR